MRIKTLGLVGLIGIATALPGASAAANDQITLAGLMKNAGITASGYLEASYTFLNTDGVFTSGTHSRVFDYQPDSFTFNQAALTFSRTTDHGFGGTVNLTAGSDADVIAAYGTGNNDNFDVTQAFVSYTTGPWSAEVGKFVTSAGAEVIDPTAGVNLSRSILFGYAIPFTHTGLRVFYKVNDALTLMGGVNNGWDQQSDQNKQKSGEFSMTYSPTATASVVVDVHSGDELGNTGISGNRTLIDVVGSYQVTDALQLVLNYDYAHQKDALSAGQGARWSGVAGYANLSLTPHWKTSLRAEYFDDKDGYRTGVPQKWKELTLSGIYSPTEHFEFLAETRYDFSNTASFSEKHGTASRKNQLSVAAGVIYKF